MLIISRSGEDSCPYVGIEEVAQIQPGNRSFRNDRGNYIVIGCVRLVGSPDRTVITIIPKSFEPACPDWTQYLEQVTPRLLEGLNAARPLR